MLLNRLRSGSSTDIDTTIDRRDAADGTDIQAIPLDDNGVNADSGFIGPCDVDTDDGRSLVN